MLACGHSLDWSLPGCKSQAGGLPRPGSSFLTGMLLAVYVTFVIVLLSFASGRPMPQADIPTLHAWPAMRFCGHVPTCICFVERSRAVALQS